MGVEENKAVLRRLVDEVLTLRNVAVVDEIFAEDFIDHQGGLGPTGGREDVKQFVAGIMAGFPDLRFELVHLVAEGDYVVVQVVSRGTHSGEFRGVAGTGRPVTIVGISISRLAGGKIVERWNVTDFAALLAQIT